MDTLGPAVYNFGTIFTVIQRSLVMTIYVLKYYHCLERNFEARNRLRFIMNENKVEDNVWAFILRLIDLQTFSHSTAEQLS